MRPPRGIRLTNRRVEEGRVVYTIQVAWWRKALLILKSLREEWTARIEL